MPCAATRRADLRAYQARLDQELILAMRESSQDGGRPVPLPLDPHAT
jgi:hypothetical protein